jgi:hypothetical protein
VDIGKLLSVLLVALVGGVDFAVALMALLVEVYSAWIIAPFTAGFRCCGLTGALRAAIVLRHGGKSAVHGMLLCIVFPDVLTAKCGTGSRIFQEPCPASGVPKA